MKEKIRHEINEYVKEYSTRPKIKTSWGQPLVGFAQAKHPYIMDLKNLIDPNHQLPEELLPGASTVIVYYLPFTRELAKINARAGRHAAAEWAIAYEETNVLLAEIAHHLVDFLGKEGHKAAISEATKSFDRDKLISYWSHRHFAYAAGLGTFGVNNMLITEKGCCGRYFSLVTDLEIEPGEPLKEDLCIHKRTGRCLVCVRNCPVNALEDTLYQRRTCYGLVQENAAIHQGYGSSYTGGSEEDMGQERKEKKGTEVCGKCITASPCAFRG